MLPIFKCGDKHRSDGGHHEPCIILINKKEQEGKTEAIKMRGESSSVEGEWIKAVRLQVLKSVLKENAKIVTRGEVIDSGKKAVKRNIVIIPTLNEELGIGETIKELKQALNSPEIIVVDAHSTDGTVEIASKLGAKVLIQGGFGKGAAVFEAFQHLESQSNLNVILIDGDYSYPAGYLPTMIRMLEKSQDVAMVIGERFFYPERFSAKVAKFVSDRYYAGNHILALIHRFNRVKLKDPLSGLRVVKCSYLKDFLPKAKGFDFEVELNDYIVNSKKGGILELPIIYRERLGKKKLGVRHGFIILYRILAMTLERK